MSERISVAIIGAGPAGLASAIYLARAGIDCKVFDPGVPGGNVFMIHQIENYPGFPEGVSGPELAQRMEAQAKRLGAEIAQVRVNKISIHSRQPKEFKLELGSGAEILARAIVLATGSKPKLLNLPGEKEFYGRGVSYCATCDGAFFKGEQVAVIGGGDSALQEALYLSNLCSKVHLIHRRDQFRAKKILQDRVSSKPNIQLVLNSIPKEIKGEKGVEAILVQDKNSGKENLIKLSGVFIYVGMTPSSELISGMVELSEDGFVKAGEDTSTSQPGIFCAGDIRKKPIRQIASAVSDGCSSAKAIEEYFLEQG